MSLILSTLAIGPLLVAAPCRPASLSWTPLEEDTCLRGPRCTRPDGPDSNLWCLQADALEAEAAAKKARSPPADIRSFLRPVGVMEMRYVKMLSDLSALTYNMSEITVRAPSLGVVTPPLTGQPPAWGGGPGASCAGGRHRWVRSAWLDSRLFLRGPLPAAQGTSLFKRHKLELVTTSLACTRGLREQPKSAAQILAEADAMAADPQHLVAAVQSARASAAPAPAPSAALAPLSHVQPLAPPAASTSGAALPAKMAATGSRSEAVASSLAAAAAAAAAAAGSIYTAAVPYAEPLANNILSVASSLPLSSLGSQLQGAAAAGHSTALATVATVSAALESTWGSTER